MSGHELRSTREAAGIPQWRLAVVMSMTQQGVSAIEKRKRVGPRIAARYVEAVTLLTKAAAA